VTSFVCKKILSISSIIFARWQNESRKLVLRGANEIAIFWEGEVVGVSDATIRKSDGGFLYVTIALSLTSRPQFAIEYIRCSKSTEGWINLWQKFVEGVDRCKTNFNAICERHGAVLCKRNRVDIFCHLSNMQERDRQTKTDRQTKER